MAPVNMQPMAKRPAALLLWLGALAATFACASSQDDPFAAWMADVATAQPTVEVVQSSSQAVLGIVGGRNATAAARAAVVSKLPPRTAVYRTLRQYTAPDGRIGLFNSTTVLLRESVWLDDMPDLQSVRCAYDAAVNVTNFTLTFAPVGKGMASNATRVLPGSMLLGSARWLCASATSADGSNGVSLRVVSAAPAAGANGAAVITGSATAAPVADGLAGVSITYFIGDPAVLPLARQLGRYPTQQEIDTALNGAAAVAPRNDNTSAAGGGGRRLLHELDDEAAAQMDVSAGGTRDLLQSPAPSRINAPSTPVSIFSVTMAAGPFSGSASLTGSIAGTYIEVRNGNYYAALQASLTAAVTFTIDAGRSGGQGSTQLRARSAIPGLSVGLNVLGTGVQFGLFFSADAPWQSSLSGSGQYTYSWSQTLAVSADSNGAGSGFTRSGSSATPGSNLPSITGTARVGMQPTVSFGVVGSFLGMQLPVVASRSYVIGLHASFAFSSTGLNILPSSFSGCNTPHVRAVSLAVFTDSINNAAGSPGWGVCGGGRPATPTPAPTPTPTPRPTPTPAPANNCCCRGWCWTPWCCSRTCRC